MTEQDEAATVGQVAERFGVTVRTLHHYDERGLLTPSGRSAAGYRLYLPADLERLATIVVAPLCDHRSPLATIQSSVFTLVSNSRTKWRSS